MPVLIPNKSSKSWKSSQEGDLFGNLVRTRGLDFNHKGYLNLARKPFVFYTESDDADFDAPLALISSDGTLFCITTDHFFYFTFSSVDVSATENNAGSPPNFGFNSDACMFQGNLHASGTTSVCSYSTGGATWTSRVTGLSSSYPHPLCVSEHQQYLAIGNGNSVKLYDTSYSLVTTLTIPTAHVVEWIRWRDNNLYIGTRNTLGGEAKLYIWNGSGTAAQRGYGAQADWLYSACEYDNSFAVMTSAGQLLRFNGGGFSELANLPVYYDTNYSWISNSSTSSLLGRVASRGMVAQGKRLYINLDGRVVQGGSFVSDFMPDQPSGLWCFDPEVGLYHKSGYGNKKFAKIQMSSVSTDTLTISTAADYETGDPVLISISGVTGLLNGKVYYAIKVDSTHLKLSLTPADAKAGTAVAGIGGTPGGFFDYVIFDTYRSVGATHCQRPGAVELLVRTTPNQLMGSEVFFTGEVWDNLAADKSVIMSLGMGKNVGSFTTPKISATGFVDVFQKIFAKFPLLNLATQKILIKYKIEDRFCMPTTGSLSSSSGAALWVNSTSFTIDPAYYETGSLAIGDEVEFIEGAAAGYTAHITNIVRSTLVTVTIDEAIPQIAASDISNFTVDNWTKYKTISLTSPDLVKEAALGLAEMVASKRSKWIQIKGELRGWSGVKLRNAIEEIAVVPLADQNYT